MATYSNITEALTANRDYVISEYNKNNSHDVFMAQNGMGVMSGWSLKDYMLAVVSFFNEHKGMANKALKSKSAAMQYICKACEDASYKMAKKTRNYNRRCFEVAAKKGYPYNM